MTETCDSWARAHVNIRAWDADRAWCAENAAWLRSAFPEAFAPSDGRFVRSAFSRDYYGRIVDALEHVRTVVDRMAGHLNLSPIWIVPPAFRYPMEPGFVTYGPWTSSSARVDAADLQDAQTDALRRKIAAQIAAGHGTRDSAGTFYTRGGTAFLDPLSGYAPPVLGRLGNRPLVAGWNGSPDVGVSRERWAIRPVAARANLITIWEYMDRPDAPYVWWNAPSATAWPTAPVSSARFVPDPIPSGPRHASAGRVVVERAGSIDDGWGRGTGALDSEANFPMPTPWLGPYANIRYAHAVLVKMASQSGHYTSTRAIKEWNDWTRGVLLLGAEDLKEQKARNPGIDVSAELDDVTKLTQMAWDLGSKVLIGAATAINPLLGAAVGFAVLVFGGIGQTPGTMSGLRRAPAWPGRAEWWTIPVGEGTITGLAPVQLWSPPPPAGMTCDLPVGGGDKSASKGSSAGLWIGGALAAGLVAVGAIALAKTR